METQLTIDTSGVVEYRAAEDPTTFYDEVDEELGSEPLGRRAITPETAQCFGPVWQAVNVIAEDVAQLPLVVYKRDDDSGKHRDRAHPASFLVHRRPNPELGPFDFKYLVQSRALLWGNGYAYIQRAGDGTPESLWPVPSDQITPVRANGELRYVYTGASGTKPLDPMDVIHIRGPGTDELCSPSVITKARITIEGGMSAEEHGTSFYRNRARPDIVLEFPNAVDERAAKNILKRWARRHSGPANSGRPGFLDNGGKVSPFSMSHQDAQWLEDKKFSKTAIAGWFKVPPHKIGDLERATFSNIEHQSIEYVSGTLMPWLIRWQDEMNYKLLTPREFAQDTHFFEYITNAMLRGDSKSRSEYYGSAINDGWMTRNEVRSLENLNRLEGLDEPLQPLNMAEAGGKDEPEEPQEADAAKRYAIRNLAKRVTAAARNASKRPTKWLDWVDNGLVTAHRSAAMEVGAACSAEDTAAFADAFIGEFREAMITAADGDPGAFEARVAVACDNFLSEKGAN